MRIWVDADACPKAIKELLFRAAERRRIAVTLVANRRLWTPPSEWIASLEVPQGFDVADERIAELMGAGDIVVTQDIPLAAEVVALGGHALTPRGELLDEENVQERLAMRNLMDELRGSGHETGGPSAPGAKESQAFANQLDRLLTRAGRAGS